MEKLKDYFAAKEHKLRSLIESLACAAMAGMVLGVTAESTVEKSADAEFLATGLVVAIAATALSACRMDDFMHQDSRNVQ